jgi:serine/threonine protein kinase
VDIWALGITLIDIITGTVPYEGEDHERIKEHILANGKPLIPTDAWDRDVADFLDQCLTVNPDQRPSATELLSHRLFQNNDVHEKSVVASLVAKVNIPRSILKNRKAGIVNDLGRRFGLQC